MRQKGVTNFISGMAIGVDMWAAEIVLDLKRAYPQDTIELIAAIPFEGQANKWSVEYRDRYFDILAQADQAFIFQEHYTKKLYARKKPLHGRQLSLYDSRVQRRKGRHGEHTTLRESKGLNIVIINPRPLA
jgi:uncharacterized phage-like protein YoqJ